MPDKCVLTATRTVTLRARTAFAMLRDGLPITGPALTSLRRQGLVFYDDTLKRWRCDPLVLRDFQAHWHG